MEKGAYSSTPCPILTKSHQSASFAFDLKVKLWLQYANTNELDVASFYLLSSQNTTAIHVNMEAAHGANSHLSTTWTISDTHPNLSTFPLRGLVFNWLCGHDISEFPFPLDQFSSEFVCRQSFSLQTRPPM